MLDVQASMNEIRNKLEPTQIEVHKYVRYLINVQNYSAERVMEKVPDWSLDKVETAIKDVERANNQPRPKRYYVSLKEPLDS